MRNAFSFWSPRNSIFLLCLMLVLVFPAVARAFKVLKVEGTPWEDVYSATCPVPYEVSAIVTVDEPGTLTYYWSAWNGGRFVDGPVESITFELRQRKPFKKTITTSGVCGTAGNPCDRLCLFQAVPKKQLYCKERAYQFKCGFTVTDLYAWDSDPAEYVGPCPKTFNFYGTIETNGPGTVTYHWKDSRLPPQDQLPRTIAFSTGGKQDAKHVSVRMTLAADQGGYGYMPRLVTTSPIRLMSDGPVPFKFVCTTLPEPLQRKPAIRAIPTPPRPR